MEHNDLDINKIKIDSKFFQSLAGDELSEAKYFDVIYNSNDLFFAKSWNTYLLPVDNGKYIERIEEINIPVNSLRFSIKSLSLRYSRDFEPSKALKDSLRTIDVFEVEVEKFGKLQRIISMLVNKFPYIKNIKITSNLNDVKLISNFVQFVQNNRSRIETFSKLFIGQYDDNANWIIKYYPRIYVYDNELEVSTVIKVKKMILQYGSGKHLIYSDENVLVFNKATYLKLSDICFENNENILEQFKNSLESWDKITNKAKTLFVIFNKDIDYITLKLCRNIAFPNFNCKFLKIVISINSKNKFWEKFKEIIQNLDKTTPVEI